MASRANDAAGHPTYPGGYSLKIFSKAALAAGLAGAIGIGMSGVVSAYAVTPVQLSGAGSDTTYFAMVAIGNKYNTTQTASHVVQIPPLNVAPFPTSVTVPADGGAPNCPAYTWDSSDPAHTPPFGSSAGIIALQNDDASATPSCLVDFARSSRGLGNPSDTPDLEQYAWALDAVTWSIEGGPSTNVNRNKHGVTNLSVGQLTKIYTCATSGPRIGQPLIRNWAQLGGTAGPIVKYAPQIGSGTLSFFQTKLLNGATVDAGCDSSHLSTRIEENEGVDIATADLPNAIFPYSYAVWKSQASKAIADRRNLMVLEKVENVAPTAKTINEGFDDTVPHFVGTRYVNNILTQNEPTYAASAAFAGINQLTLTNGYLCQDANATARGALVTIMAKYGFTPLLDTVEGSGQPNGYCRFNPTPL
jgi:phosphate transport system substrate-binding protein